MCSWVENFNIFMSSLPRLIYRVTSTSVKTQWSFFFFLVETGKLILKFMWKCEEARIAKTTLNDAGEFIRPDFKISYRATAFRTRWYWCQKRAIERGITEQRLRAIALQWSPGGLARIHTGHTNKSLNHCWSKSWQSTLRSSRTC